MLVSLFELETAVDPERFKVAIAEAMGRHEHLKSKVTLMADGNAFFEAIPRPKVKVSIEKYEPAESEDEESLLDIAFEWADEAVKFDLDLSSGELMRHILISDGKTLVWGIASHYLTGDALSIQYLARDVFALLDDSDLKLPPLAWQAPAAADMISFKDLAWPARLKVKRLNKLWRHEGKAFGWGDLSRMRQNFHEAYPLHVLHDVLEPETVRGLRALSRKHNIHFCSLFAAAYIKATNENDSILVQVSTRPEGYEGVGTYLGGVTPELGKKRGERPLLEIAKLFSEKLDEDITNPQKLHHAAIVLLGMEGSLIDAGYYSAYDGNKSKTALMMRQLYGLGGSGSGTQLSNLKVVPAKAAYRFGKVNAGYCLTPVAPNVSRNVSVMTVGETLGFTVGFYQDPAYENFLMEKVLGMLREAAAGAEGV